MSKNSVASNIKLNSLDELFGNTSTSSDIDSTKEEVLEVSLSDLHTFSHHPFRVIDDEKMDETVESIKEHGVLVPGIVRRRAKGGYEIISGHRRKRACEKAGLKTMPVFVRDLTDDEATIVMVDSNIQREEILPSEKAKAYKMKYDAMKHQGKAGGKGESLNQMSDEVGESRKTLQRYIKIADLNDELLELIDKKDMGFTQGYELAFLTPDEQNIVYELIQETSIIPSLSQSNLIKDLSRRGEFSAYSAKNVLEGKYPEIVEEKREVIEETLEIPSNPSIEHSHEVKDLSNKDKYNNSEPVKNITEQEEKKKQSRRVLLKEDIINKYFPEEYNEEQIIDQIIKLLDNWKK